MIKFFENRKISEQIITMLFGVSIAFIMIWGIQLSLYSRTYEEYAVGYADSTIYYLSENIEREIERIKQLSLTVITNKSIATLCRESAKVEDVSNKILINTELQDALQNLTSGFVYIEAISIFDIDGRKISGGNDPELIKYFDQSILTEAHRLQGRIHWVVDLVPESILLTRDILIEQEDGLAPVGTVVVNINVERLISLLDLFEKRSATSLGIMTDQRVLYNNTLVSDDNLLITNGSRSGVNKIGGKSYISGKGVSQIPELRYITLTTYDSVLDSLNRINFITIAIMLIFFVIIAFVVKKIAAVIIKPINMLSCEMEIMSGGCFDISEYEKPYDYTKNEIHSFHNGFYKMIETINEFIEKNYQVEIEKKNLELIALHDRINPHFLYNTLNTIQWLTMAGRTSESANATFLLGQMLRNSLDVCGTLVTANRELQFINQYLDIQKIRFTERLEVTASITKEAENYMVPKFILQPIVENSIKHVVEESVGTCHIDIIVETDKTANDVLLIRVADNGPRCITDYKNKLLDDGKLGIGLDCVIKLIEKTFATGSKVDFRVTEDGLFETQIKIIYQDDARWQNSV